MAFANFWSHADQKRRTEKLTSAAATRQSRDQAASAVLSRVVAADQKRSHLQVFSTAPATEGMTSIQLRLPAVQQELGVDRIISKWDAGALRSVPADKRIDVTNRLVREFNLTPERQKMLDAMLKTEPLPLDEATKLADEGKL